MIKPVLIFGYGNPSRGDDALGPELLNYLQSQENINLDQVELLTDFQLQIEHALDMERRQLILFADASVTCAAPYEFNEVQSASDNSYSTHAMSPAAVLQVYRTIVNADPPPAFLLSIRGERFGLGQPLSAVAQHNLHRAGRFVAMLLRHAGAHEWRGFSGFINTYGY
jgi:hydrogenase maturation protease